MPCDVGAVGRAVDFEAEEGFKAVDDLQVVPGGGHEHQFFSGDHVFEEPRQAVEPVELLPVVPADVTHLFCGTGALCPVQPGHGRHHHCLVPVFGQRTQ